nr:hypothetical protein [Tanacetum cinerariifolium]
MGDEHLDIISATKSDIFIKSSVENLVPNPSESKGESECDMAVCEDFTTFLNILFDFDYDFYSCDDQSFSDEDLSKEIYSNPLFEEEIIPMKIDQHHYNAESDLIESLRTHDSSIIISSKIDSLFDEFAGQLTLLKSIPSGIDETDCYPKEETHFTKRLLYDNSSLRPPKEFVSDSSDTEIESFFSSLIPIKDSDSLMEEIDLSFTPNYPMLPGIEEDDYDSERHILIYEELLSDKFLSLPKIKLFHFDIPSFSRPHAKPPDGNTRILNVKMMGGISEQNVPMPRLMITLVPNQEKSPDLLSHQGLKAFHLSADCPMMIHGKNTPILDESEPRQEEIDVVSVTNDVLPPSVDNDDSDEEVDAIGDLSVDNFIQNSEHEYSEGEDSDFDNPLLLLPPPKPPDKKFDFENEILVEFSLLFAESEDMIFDPGISD